MSISQGDWFDIVLCSLHIINCSKKKRRHIVFVFHPFQVSFLIRKSLLGRSGWKVMPEDDSLNLKMNKELFKLRCLIMNMQTIDLTFSNEHADNQFNQWLCRQELCHHPNNEFDQWSRIQWLCPMIVQTMSLSDDHADNDYNQWSLRLLLCRWSCRHWLWPVIIKTMTLKNYYADNNLDQWP